MHLDVWTWWRRPAEVQIEHQNWGEKGDYERVMVIGARLVGLNISEIDDLLGFSHTAIFGVYRALEKSKYPVTFMPVVHTGTIDMNDAIRESFAQVLKEEHFID